MADKFIIPALKDMSLERFKSAANRAEGMSTWKCDSFPLVVDEIYDSTTRSDLGLKGILCRLLVIKRGNKELWSSMQPVFRKHADLATGVLNYWDGGGSSCSFFCPHCRRSHRHDSNAAGTISTEDWIQKEISFMSMTG